MLADLAIAVTIASTQPTELFGSVPAAIGTVSRVIWIDADDESPDGVCELASATRWHCVVPGGNIGLVVFYNDSAVAFTAIGVPAQDAVRQWGRVLRVEPGALDLVELRELRVTSWVPERPRARPRTRRLTPIEDPSVTVTPLSSRSFWILGSGNPQSDAYIQLTGKSIASVRLPTALLASDTPDIPVLVSVDRSNTLEGRVETRDGEVAPGAEVELFTRLVGGPPDEPWQVAELVRTRTTSASSDGVFQFDGLSIDSFLIVASHRSLGRAELVASPPDGLAVLKLRPPSRITGRVLKDSLPVPGARVRFVPDISAWTESVDPRQHLTEEIMTGEDGRFSLVLPPESAGFVQVMAPDGAAKRLPVSQPKNTSEVALGDIVLPERRRLDVRLLSGGSCELFATGPLGALGLTIVRATSVSSVFSFDLPEPGQWSLNAECEGRSVALQPQAVLVAPDGPIPMVDVVAASRR